MIIIKIGKITLYPLKFHPNYNFASKVKKVTINPNKVSKICNVAIPLANSVFPDRNHHTCGARLIFGPDLTKIASSTPSSSSSPHLRHD
jgi:hypothetical protein